MTATHQLPPPDRARNGHATAVFKTEMMSWSGSYLSWANGCRPRPRLVVIPHLSRLMPAVRNRPPLVVTDGWRHIIGRCDQRPRASLMSGRRSWAMHQAKCPSLPSGVKALLVATA
jgi:hypothetical protein